MIEVACAIIMNSEGEVLAAQRSSAMELPGKWEFPGGKIEAGESAEQCLVREIREELGITVLIIRRLADTVHAYPGKTVKLIPFICRWLEGDIELKEHSALRWLSHQDLFDIDWADADVPVVRLLK